MPYVSVLVLSFFISLVLIPVFARLALKFGVFLDIPDERKVHCRPTPRIGGVGIVVAVFGAVAFWMPPSDFFWAYVIGSAIILLFGLVDDCRGLDFRVKFLAQVMAALVVVTYGGLQIKSLGVLLPDGLLLPDALAIPLTVLAIVGVTNAINLADGLDGLAGGICFLSFCCIGYLAYLMPDTTLCLIGVAFVGATTSLLRYNTHPAELFLGDVGSQFLGFSAITLSLAVTQGPSPFSPLLPILLLGLPVLDTLDVMVKRISERRPLFAPDKHHLHHRLMSIGLNQAEAVLAIYFLQTLFVVGAYFLRFHWEWVILTSYVVLSALILVGLSFAAKTDWKVQEQQFFGRFFRKPLEKALGNQLIIRGSFKAMRLGTLLLLIVLSFLPESIPRQFSLLCLGCLAFLGLLWPVKRPWIRGGLNVVVYLFVPIVILFGIENQDPELDFLRQVSNLFYLVVVFSALLTLRLTRRKRGFKTTPMDFLILFIALTVPTFLSAYLPFTHFPMVMAKTLMLFFVFEVLVGELRGRLGGLTLATATPLAVVAIRGLVGI